MAILTACFRSDQSISLTYSALTICTRQLFLPDMEKGKEQAIISMLHGVNELHHTLANWLVDYATDESKALPVDVLSQQLLEIANQYRIEGCLSSAVEVARTRKFPTKA